MGKYIISRIGIEMSGNIVEVDEKHEPIECKIDSPFIPCSYNGETYLFPSFYFTKYGENKRMDKIAVDFLKQAK